MEKIIIEGEKKFYFYFYLNSLFYIFVVSSCIHCLNIDLSALFSYFDICFQIEKKQNYQKSNFKYFFFF